MTARKAVITDGAPAAIGPYSQAITAGEFIFTSGQIPLDPATGQVVPGGIAAQAVCVMENLEAVLEAAGSDLSRVCKTTIFLKDLGEFGTVNEIYAGYFGAEPPARACVQVARLPKDVLIEVEAIALLK